MLAFGLIAALLPLVGSQLADATTNGSMPSNNEQILYAYTDAGGTLDVSATFKNRDADSSWSTSVIATAVIKVKDPAGVEQSITKAYNGSSDVTVSRTGITSSDGGGGVWRVEITSLDSSGDPADLNGSEAARVVVTPWSVVPRQAGVAKSGRVWTESLNSFQDNATNYDIEQDFTIWNLSDTGVMYKDTYTDFMGIVSRLTVDDLGVGDANCNPTYKSWNYGSTGTKRASSCASATRYRIFLDSPDSTMPETARAWGYSSTWVYPQYRAATVSSVMLYEANTTYHSGTLSARVGNQKGTLTFGIDTNNNGSFTDTVDRTIGVGDIDANTTATVAWDGRDGAGNLIDRRTRGIRLKASLSDVGEIHFVRTDVEIAAGGIEVTQMIGPDAGTAAAKELSWNDSSMGTKCMKLDTDGVGWLTVTCTGSPTTPLAATRANSGAPTAGGVHAWDSSATNHQGGWGDSRYIDDWASFSETVTATTSVFDDPSLYPDLGVSLTDGRTTVAPLDSLTYTATTTNSHAWLDEANGTMVAYVPAGVTYQSASGAGSYNAANRTVTWTGIPVAAGGSASRTVTVTVDKAIVRPASFTGYATVQATAGPAPTSNPAAGCTGPQCASDTDTVPVANLAVTKDDSQTVINRGGSVTWTLVGRNNGAVNEPETLIVDTLPAGFDFVSASNSGVWNAAGRTITYPRFALGAGGSASRTVTARVRLDTARPTSLTNYATITPTDDSPADPTLGCAAPRCDSDTDQTVLPQLTVSKTDGLTDIGRGQATTYTVTATNNGTVDENDSIIVDTLPVGSSRVDLQACKLEYSIVSPK